MAVWSAKFGYNTDGTLDLSQAATILNATGMRVCVCAYITMYMSMCVRTFTCVLCVHAFTCVCVYVRARVTECTVLHL